MNKTVKLLAFDFGASSGRAMLGTLDGEKLSLQEMHRFSNDPVRVGSSLYWDILRLLHEVKNGILKCIHAGNKDIASLAVDTWGVDFGLLDAEGNLMGNPYHYRDSRTDGMMEEVFRLIPREELYRMTGIQFMKLNTIFQLYAMKHRDSRMLKEAETLLLMPDLIHYFLTGRKVSEYSIATTTQLLDIQTRQWSAGLMEKLGLNPGIFPPIVPTGTVIGTLSPDITEELGVPPVPVVAAAGHDTQAAIASVPSADRDFVYISCGTWSLMGVELEDPVIDERSLRLSFTNEGGAERKISFLKNIMGLWLVQECKRQWDREGESLDFARLEAMAWEAEPFLSFIDPDDESFAAPGDMPGRIRDYCKRTGQPVPAAKGEIVRCISQSLALKYKLTVESLETILGRKLPVVHMVGGGIKDTMLCRFTANATGRRVEAGPVEATAVGNLMIQAMALGFVKDLGEARSIVRNSFPIKTYLPENAEDWNMAYGRFKQLTGCV